MAANASFSSGNDFGGENFGGELAAAGEGGGDGGNACRNCGQGELNSIHKLFMLTSVLQMATSLATAPSLARVVVLVSTV
jgi:hypothetical protein